MNEFDLIARHLAPIAGTAPEARGLADDVALIRLDGPHVWTADAIVESVHFLPDDPLDSVARKALRVNVSDIVAKGARPVGFLLTVQWPAARDEAQFALFAEGLARDAAEYGMGLWGGDTTATPGPLAVSVSMVGRPTNSNPACATRTPARAGAGPGEDVWVSGTIGDAGLGLALLQGEALGAAPDERAFLVDRYRLPSPPVALAPLIGEVATAAMDVSDGLLADAAKLAAASRVRIVIEPSLIPLSAPAKRLAAGDLQRLCAAGDDYQALFTAAERDRARIAAFAQACGVSATRIGRVEEGSGVEAGGLSARGFVHRLG